MRALFVGLGGIGQRHLRILRDLIPNVEISAVRKRGRRFEITDQLEADYSVDLIEKYQIREFSTLADALRAGQDFAIVANPTRLHLETAYEIIVAGVPVLVEKPLSDQAGRIDEFVNLIKDSGVCVRVGYMTRFHPAAKRMQQILASGVLGEVHCINFWANSYMPEWHRYEPVSDLYASREDLGGGVLATEVHEIDLLCWLFGRPTMVMSIGKSSTSQKWSIHDTACVLIEQQYQGAKVITSGLLSFAQRKNSREIMIWGELGLLNWNIASGELKLNYEDKDEIWRFDHIERNSLFQEQMVEFLEAMQSSATPTTVVDDILNTHIAVTALNKALRTGSVVEIQSC